MTLSSRFHKGDAPIEGYKLDKQLGKGGFGEVWRATGPGGFPLARMLEKTKTGHTGAMSVKYAAPEFFKKQASAASDQYCSAVTYCELRAGILPFEGTLHEVMMGHIMHQPALEMLPVEERFAIAKAMSKNPKERWGNCKEMVQAVRVPVPVGVPPGILAEVPTPPPFGFRLARGP